MAAPNYIPDEMKELYDVFQAQGDTLAIQELEDLYKPQEQQQVATPVTPVVAKDPFGSITPMLSPDTNEERMAMPLDEARPVMTPLTADATAAVLSAQPTAQQLDDELKAPNKFYERVLQASVYDPDIMSAVQKSHERLTEDLDRDQGKTFNFLVEENIKKGQDLFQAQQNAWTTISGIINADRIQQGFLAPPVKAGEKGVPDLRMDVEPPTLGEALSRKTYSTEQQTRDAERRKKEAEALKATLKQSFYQQAKAEIKPEDYADNFEYRQAFSDRADELEANYVQGELLRSITAQVRDGIYQHYNLPMNQSLNADQRKELQEISAYYYDNYVNNIYPEYSGVPEIIAQSQPEEPSFLKEVMVEERETGDIVETRTGQALRVGASLIRPATELVGDLMTYPVIKNEDGTFEYPEGEGYFLQQPLTTTQERQDLGYWGRVIQDTFDARSFSADTMAMPALTKEIGEEYAGILGLGIEVMLPVTPIGLLGPAAKATGATAKLAPAVTRTMASTGRAFGSVPYVGVIGRGMEKTGEFLTNPALKAEAAGTYITDTAAPVLDNLIGAGAEKIIQNKTNKAMRQMEFDISDVDIAANKLAGELDDLIARGELSQAEQVLKAEMEVQLEALRGLRQSGMRKINLLDLDEPIPTEALIRLAESKTGNAANVINDIAQAQRLLDEATLNGTKSLDITSAYTKRLYSNLYKYITEHPYSYTAQIDDFVKQVINGGEFTEDVYRSFDELLQDDAVNAFLQKQVAKDYIEDYAFNLFPENFVFISDRIAVSVPAYKKYAQQVNARTKEILSEGITFTPNKAMITLEQTAEGEATIAELVRYLDRAYGPAPSKVVADLKQTLLTSAVDDVIDLTQQEFNLLHSAVKEQIMFEAIAAEKGVDAGKYLGIQPRRATKEAVEIADVPMERRNLLFRGLGTLFRSPSGKGVRVGKARKLTYTDASQYGLVRMLQETESAYSNLPQTMQSYVKLNMDVAKGDVNQALNAMLRQQSPALGFLTDEQILNALVRGTFNTSGISDDIIDAFVASRIEAGNLDLVSQYNRLYDEFVAAYPSKEVTAIGGKFIDRKNTIIPMLAYIAEGQKATIATRVTDKIADLYPDLFYTTFKSKEEMALIKQQLGEAATARAVALEKEIQKATAEFDANLQVSQQAKAKMTKKEPITDPLYRRYEKARASLEELPTKSQKTIDGLETSIKETNELYNGLVADVRAGRKARVDAAGQGLKGDARKAAKKAEIEKVNQEIADLNVERAAANDITKGMIASERELAQTQAQKLRNIIQEEITREASEISTLRTQRAQAVAGVRDPTKTELQTAYGRVREAERLATEAPDDLLRMTYGTAEEVAEGYNQLNLQVSKAIYETIGKDLQEIMEPVQRRFMNAFLSDLYEQAGVIEYKLDYKVLDDGLQVSGGYTLGAQANIQISKAINQVLTKGNIRKVMSLLNGMDFEKLKPLVEGIEVSDDIITRLDLAPDEVLASKFILQMLKENNLQSMEKLMGFNPTGFISALESVGFPPVSIPLKFESLRPIIAEWNGKGIIATAQDVATINKIKQASIDGTLGKTFEILGRKNQSAVQYALSSMGYGFGNVMNSTKGGMLGGTFAPTGKYLSVNAITAPFILAFTTPQVASKAIAKAVAGGVIGGIAGGPVGATAGIMLSGPLMRLIRAYGKTSAQANKTANFIIGAIGGATTGGFAGGLVGAGIGAAAGGGFQLAAHLLSEIIEGAIRAGGREGFIGGVAGMLTPEAKALTTMDGRVITAFEFQEMVQRNNILFSQVNLEFGQRTIDQIIRQLEAGATGKKVGAFRNAFRWLRPDRPNFYNTIGMETDNAVRMQVFYDALYLGHTEKEAAELARRSLFDYSDLSEIEKTHLSTFFLFYSFMRQSGAELMSSIGKDPTAVRNIFAAIKFAEGQKKLAGTDALFNDTSQKEKALAAIWTKFGTSFDETMTLHYGPAFPSTESFIMMTNVFYLIYDTMPMTEYDVEGSLVNNLMETFVVKGNPYARAAFEINAKKFRSENAPHGLVPVREVIVMKQTGMWDVYSNFLEIEPIPPEEMRVGNPTYPDGEMNVQYRFATKSGSQKYLAYKSAVLAMGLDRGMTDWASSTAERLELQGARMKRYSDGNLYLEAAGLSTPIAVPSYIQERDKVMKQIQKELRAEMD